MPSERIQKYTKKVVMRLLIAALCFVVIGECCFNVGYFILLKEWLVMAGMFLVLFGAGIAIGGISIKFYSDKLTEMEEMQ